MRINDIFTATYSLGSDPLIPRAEADSQKVKRASDRSDVFDEITRLRKKGLSVAKALRSMRIRGTYAARLGRISDATWQRYYTARARPKPAK